MANPLQDSLRFIRSAENTSSSSPAAKHFIIENGSITSYNGVLTISSPFAAPVDCAPNASAFAAAVKQCGDVVSLDFTADARLYVRSDGFGAYVDCFPLSELPRIGPAGSTVAIDGELFLTALKTLLPIIGGTQQHAWANGVLLKGGCAFATNNVVLAQYWLGEVFPYTVNIPYDAVVELLRIKEAPTHLQMTGQAVTVHYADGKWLHTPLLEHNGWPVIEPLLDVPSKQQPVPEGFFEGVKAIKSFVTDEYRAAYLYPGYIGTHRDLQGGAYHKVDGLDATAIFAHRYLEMLDGVATTIDFSTYPAPCLFRGERLRGAIAGLRW